MRKITKKMTKLNKEGLEQVILSDRKKTAGKFPEKLLKGFEIDEFKESGFVSYRMIPQDNFDETYIVYLYGGGMCQNIDSEQWDFITKLALRHGCGLFVPMYPIAPENSCGETFKMLCKAYSDFAMGMDVKKIILIGDSSGAGLALSLTMLAWQEGLRKPDKMILLSPVIDTEFFDKELEEIIDDTIDKSERIFYNQNVKDFLNTYWVKDYAVKTDYTSPYYGDFTDLCDDVVIFSSTEDMVNCYARAFYNKAKAQGIKIRFFEFEEGYHDFMVYENHNTQKNALRYLDDVIAETYNNSLQDLYILKLLSDWTKKYPEMIKDEWASKFIYEHKFDFSKINTHLSEYNNLVLATTVAACDDKVRRFIMKFPFCTVINLGCRLDNMFKRVDNGRIHWYNVDTHNIMSVRREMYGERERETTIGRSMTDFSWIEEISCKRNHGVLFVCNYTLSYMRKSDVQELIGKISSRFPGAELVFSIASLGTTLYMNSFYKKNVFIQAQKRFYINDTQKLFSSWQSSFKLMEEEPLMKYLPKETKLKLSTRFHKGYNKIAYNHKIVHVKLGSESYEINV